MSFGYIPSASVPLGAYDVVQLPAVSVQVGEVNVPPIPFRVPNVTTPLGVVPPDTPVAVAVIVMPAVEPTVVTTGFGVNANVGVAAVIVNVPLGPVEAP
jgi:hypothetical protein